MVQTLDRIGDSLASNPGKGCATPLSVMLRSFPLAKEVDCWDESVNDPEFCEPECELDPFSPRALSKEVATEVNEDRSLQIAKPAHARRSRKRVSLIDKARACEQKQPIEEHGEPVYICFSDLAADWSYYIAKPVTRLFSQPPPGMISVGDSDENEDEEEAVESSKPRRIRKKKKSLIDKAATRQREELWALHEALSRAIQTKAG
jgi:hypothetical protein|mmetsp:Transcript_48055/g.74822  ORF Transcript_48055/g.74822 Transcript_48055/m.74822 type:complete len:205 (-) Transcript_48055:32-646(-)|eukprot:CAMPEP_0169185956 /NCGR_PEP_ID=MMETSP1016-20121227/2084_1 /TAXON_ID=342587 /ORGANISM="Karlodinium micrum, Strain CCMP2283" /LENGTH=204 /DNA_ID=CAMNT_0009261717 /DNA_START=60 /DNA_END=674 /DNA_ORIENTATION=+